MKRKTKNLLFFICGVLLLLSGGWFYLKGINSPIPWTIVGCVTVTAGTIIILCPIISLINNRKIFAAVIASVFGIAFLYNVWAAARTLQGPFPNFEKVKEGMTKEEVVNLIGHLGGLGNISSPEIERLSRLLGIPEERAKEMKEVWWEYDNTRPGGGIEIYFDEGGKVVYKSEKLYH